MQGEGVPAHACIGRHIEGGVAQAGHTVATAHDEALMALALHAGAVEPLVGRAGPALRDAHIDLGALHTDQLVSKEARRTDALAGDEGAVGSADARVGVGIENGIRRALDAVAIDSEQLPGALAASTDGVESFSGRADIEAFN